MHTKFTRREGLFLGVAGLLTLAVRPAAARVQQNFGGTGGVAFEPSVVRSIGIRSGKFVDALVLNGVNHGGIGGVPSTVYTLEGDDYINHIDIRSGGYVDYLSFRTKNDLNLSGGGPGGAPQSLSNIRVTRLSGRSGGFLDQLSIEYVPNYAESVVAQAGRQAIFAFSPPGSQIQEYQEREIQTLRAYESILTTMLAQLDASGSVDLAMLAAKASGSLSVTEDTKTVRESLEERKKSGTAQTISVPDNAVGLLVGAVSVMRAPGGNFWLKPEMPPSWTVFKKSQWQSVFGYFDVTGSAAATQMGLHTKEKGNLRVISA